jgi:hypothetical protein
MREIRRDREPCGGGWGAAAAAAAIGGGGVGIFGREGEGVAGVDLGEPVAGDVGRQLRGFGHRVGLLLGAGAEIGERGRRGAIGGRVGHLAGLLPPWDEWCQVGARFREEEGGQGGLYATTIWVDGERLAGIWRAALWLRPLREEWERRIRAAQLRLLWRQVPRAWFVVEDELPPQAVIPGLGIQRWGDLGGGRWGGEQFRLERMEGGCVVEARAGMGREIAGFLSGGVGEGWVLMRGGVAEDGGLGACYRRSGGRVMLR